MTSEGWIGVDLDGTLAHYESWSGPEHIGAPIMPMVERVKGWLEEGKTVKIFTARVANPLQANTCKRAIQKWCLEHLDRILEITCIKDTGMIALYDDRCVQVETNTGRVIGEGA